MADPQSQVQLEPNGTMSQEDLAALMNQTKMNLVAQFPYLASNPDFASDLSNAFSNFSSRGVQVGSDYNQLYNQVIQPFVNKWSFKGAQDTAKLWQTQELGAIKIARETGSPTTAVSAFPQLISPKSPYAKQWTAQMQKEDITANQNPKLTLGQRDQHNELDAAVKAARTNLGTSNTPENQAALLNAQKALMDFDNKIGVRTNGAPAGGVGGSGVVATPQAGPQPSAPPPVVPSAPPLSAPVAAPMGTSGFVQPGVSGNGSTFIGSPNAAQAAQLLNQWNNRLGPNVNFNSPPPGPPVVPPGNAVTPVGGTAGGPKPALLPPGFGMPGSTLQPAPPDRGTKTPAITKEDALWQMGLYLDKNGQLQGDLNVQMGARRGGNIDYGIGGTAQNRIQLAQKILANPNIPWGKQPTAAPPGTPPGQPGGAAPQPLTAQQKADLANQLAQQNPNMTREQILQAVNSQ